MLSSIDTCEAREFDSKSLQVPGISITDTLPSPTASSTDQETLLEINQSKKRNRHMHHYFPLLPPSEVCIADFSCALQKDLLIRHGRLYIGRQFICFHSPIANTRWKIHVSMIDRIIPKSVLMVPTALLIETEKESIFLMSFAYRQNCIRALKTVIAQYRNLNGSDTTSANFEIEPEEVFHDLPNNTAQPNATSIAPNMLVVCTVGVFIILHLWFLVRSIAMMYTVY